MKRLLLLLWVAVGGVTPACADLLDTGGGSSPNAASIGAGSLPATVIGSSLAVAALSIAPLHVGGCTSLALTSGTTFFRFTPDRDIKLKRVSATVQVAGVGVQPDTWTIGNAASQCTTTTTAALAAGGGNTSVCDVAITSGTVVYGYILQGDTTAPGGCLNAEYLAN